MKGFFTKKRIVLLLLVALLFAACYANNIVFNRFAQVDEEDNPLNAELVNTYSEDEIMSGEKSVSSDFFEKYRLEREKTRSENIETLKSITVSVSDTDTSAYERAVNEMVELVELSEKELYIENIVKSKGFSDCVVFIHSGYVNVVVEGEELTARQAVQVQDIIANECGVELSKITIAKSK